MVALKLNRTTITEIFNDDEFIPVIIVGAIVNHSLTYLARTTSD